MRRIWISGALVAAVAAIFLWRVDACPQPVSLAQYWIERYWSTPPAVGVTFLGVSTLLIDDGTDAVMVDGFFTRPTINLLNFENSPVSPNEGAIDAALADRQISIAGGAQRALTLRGVAVNHSHYDHAMDAPLVAKKTGAVIAGSLSTTNLARTHQVQADKIAADFDPSAPKQYCFGPFRVTAIRTGHVGSGILPGDIPANTIPATVGGYNEGGTFALLVRRRFASTMLVQGSAGFLADALQGRQADAAFLAVGNLSQQTTAHQDGYWNETVGKVAPRRVIPIHWDRLSGALSNDPLPLFGEPSLRVIGDKARSAGLECVKPRVRERFDPFAPAGASLGDACP